ncbi:MULTISPECIES: amidase [unclassified Rhizobium]|uniref:amidase n=1 Tax=unclassified Rhizobium TaxID=2613769 RepID=UPI0007E93DBB|nr:MULTISPECIES: amidase family protein [unclassified Rhizobium]ANM12976.1 amidase protein [Rhizobium sp. N324]OYD01437.1 amidase protein [Rhizobium sp. N4311]
MNDLSSLAPPDGLALAAAIRSGRLSRQGATSEAVARFRRVNPALNAIVDDLGDDAIAAVATAPDGVFGGVPTVVKDLFMPVAGARMTNGSLICSAAIAPFDAEVVRRGRTTGIAILATTTSPEFGTSYTTESRLFGKTANPWSLEHTAGGSSGGSAALVAARAVPFAFGNDGGGSLRVPASCCGIFGLKPSRGRVPMGPMIGEGWAGMGCNNIMSISVRDSAAMLDALSGMDTGAPYAAPHDADSLLSCCAKRPAGLRIGLVTRLDPFETNGQCLQAVEDAARLCEELGHQVETTTLPVDAIEYYDTVFTIIGAQTTSFLSMIEEMGGQPVDHGELEARTRIILREKGGVSGASYAAAVDYIHAFGRRMGRLLEDYDVLLSPTLAKPPQLLGSFDMKDRETLSDLIERFHSFSPFTSLFNASGQPAMSVPLCWSPEGLPVGVHFAAGFGREALLFSLAAQLEEARPWAGCIPPLNALTP